MINKFMVGYLWGERKGIQIVIGTVEPSKILLILHFLS